MAQSLSTLQRELKQLRAALASQRKRTATARRKAERALARREQAEELLQAALSVLESTRVDSVAPDPFAARAIGQAIAGDGGGFVETIVAARQANVPPQTWAHELVDELDDDWSVHDVYEIYYNSSGELG